MFKIDASGDIIALQARAPNPILRKEAERVVNLLSKVQPAKQGGRTVGVCYSIPISFDVQY